jgi:hypothetical protein
LQQFLQGLLTILLILFILQENWKVNHLKSKQMHLSLSILLISQILLNAAIAYGAKQTEAVEIKSLSSNQVVSYKNSYALVIGVSDYKHGWNKLPYALRNAEAVAEELKRRDFHVMTLYDPTGSELRSVIDSLAYKSGSENDRFIFYFAGHGVTISSDSNSTLGYILPKDAPDRVKQPDLFKDKALSMKRIADVARKSPVKHALFLFDCCFSGAILSHGWIDENGVSNKWNKSARQFITAGKRDEKVPDNSIFTYCLMAGLEGNADLNADACITASELSIYIRDNTSLRSSGSLHSQYGRIHDPDNNRGDFVFGVDLPEMKPKSELYKNINDLNSSLTNINLEEILPDFKFTVIPAGSFLMGSEVTEIGRDDDETPQHRVTVKSFFMQTTEVTQRLWKLIMGNNPSFYQADVLPVEQVSWIEVNEFIRRINEIDPGKTYRLPSEAEWEYACRAESSTRFPWGDDPNYYSLDIFCWVSENNRGATHPIAQKRPNAWGLYDMHGNVFEWCQDWYHNAYFGAPSDGSAWVSPIGEYRVHRGGSSVMDSWEYNARRCRSAFRSRSKPASRHYDLGFRLVKEK